MSVIIYLIGKPGTGKYTIAQKLAQYNYVICDNQLINNPIFALLGYDTLHAVPEFAWNTIDKIRNNIFNFMIKEQNNNYVLTNALYEEKGDQKLFDRVQTMALKRKSLFIPVKLHISVEEHIKRIANEKRKLRYKSIDTQYAHCTIPLIQITHPHVLELEVTHLTAQLAAQEILNHVHKIIKSTP